MHSLENLHKVTYIT